MSLLSIRASSDANSAEQKRLVEKKRSILVLINHHLIESGYFETAERLQHEAGNAIGKFAVADNIDLNLILSEYEAYYDMRFDKKPKLIRKLENDEIPGNSKKPTGKKSSTSKEKKTDSSDNNSEKSSKLPNLPGVVNSEPESSLGIAGTSMNTKKPAEDTIKFEERILKPPPQLGGDAEQRQLVNVICREIYQESPNIRFSDIVELKEAKRLLIEAVQLPLRFPYLFTGILRPWRGILLHGPPGTGKTLLAKAVATECNTTFFNISASTLVSKWRGDSEKLVRILFEVARYYAPSTIFLDEIDSILTSRNGEGGEHEASRRMKTELLIQMDGVISNNKSNNDNNNSQVFVMAASNLPWDLDVAVLRRLEKRVLVPLPKVEARKAMLHKHLSDRCHDSLDFNNIAERTEGYSGADIELLSRESAMMPVRRLMERIHEAVEDSGDLLIPDPPNSKKPNNMSNRVNNRNNAGNNVFANNVQNKQYQVEAIEDFLKKDPVTMEDIENALKSTKPSSDGNVFKYEQWQKDFGAT